MKMGAVITSAANPQLPRCVEAVKNQTVPFSEIIHIESICPLSEAFNQGMRSSKEKWMMRIDGDMILDLDAAYRMMNFMRDNPDDKVSGYYFGLYDTFLQCKIGHVPILNGSLYRMREMEDKCAGDWRLVRRLRKEGWRTIANMNMLVGTHFDQPDEFQVFSRFYYHGFRYAAYPHRTIKKKLIPLYERTRNPLYKVAIEAVDYGVSKRYYPGGHNLEFDRKNYEEWKTL